MRKRSLHRMQRSLWKTLHMDAYTTAAWFHTQYEYCCSALLLYSTVVPPTSISATLSIDAKFFVVNCQQQKLLLRPYL